VHLYNLSNVVISARTWFFLIPSSKMQYLVMQGGDGLSYAGAKIIPNATYRWVDVRDVANAHILAFENPTASGRYCLVGRVMHCYEVVKILRELFSDLNLPEK
jgi:nucleoside-diphosphate-sugar epimerase